MFSRLCAIDLSVSHTTLMDLLNQLGISHDAIVKKWRDDIVANLCSASVSE